MPWLQQCKSNPRLNASTRTALACGRYGYSRRAALLGQELMGSVVECTWEVLSRKVKQPVQ
eukprot:5921124-Amphidinium_carterae.1